MAPADQRRIEGIARWLSDDESSQRQRGFRARDVCEYILAGVVRVIRTVWSDAADMAKP